MSERDFVKVGYLAVIVDIHILDVARTVIPECLDRRIGHIRLVDEEPFRYESVFLVK